MSRFDKPVFIGMSTFNGRTCLDKAIASLRNQCEGFVLYDNSKEPVDKADNGKFYGLTKLYTPCYYLTCDDDLLYPPTYVEDMVKAIQRHNCIVTHHGRQLQGQYRSYYYGHKAYRCLNEVAEEQVLDVPGTGVTGFDTTYFNPLDLHSSPDLRMSDLVFALEAAKQDKRIMLLTHPRGYIQQLEIDVKTSICATQCRNDKRQSQIADDIWKLKH